MFRKSFVVTLCLLTIFCVSCRKKVENVEAINVESVKVEHLEFREIVSVFQGFLELVERNKNNPAVGVREGEGYTQKNIVLVKELESKIKSFEKDKNYINELIETNNKIKEITDKITMISNEYYGYNSVDIILQLSDMALARLTYSE